MKRITTVYIDEEDYQKIKSLGFNVSEVVRRAIKSIIYGDELHIDDENSVYKSEVEKLVSLAKRNPDWEKFLPIRNSLIKSKTGIYVGIEKLKKIVMERIK